MTNSGLNPSAASSAPSLYVFAWANVLSPQHECVCMNPFAVTFQEHTMRALTILKGKMARHC